MDRTALMIACQRGDEDIVKHLLSREDIKINQVDRDGDAALIWAVHSADLVKHFLIRGDIAINLPNYYGHIALMLAVANNNEEVVQLLLTRKDIDVNACADFACDKANIKKR